MVALGYVQGSEPSAGDGGSGVVRHERDRAWQGLDLVVSAHAKLLPDGNTLITETQRGRAFEVGEAETLANLFEVRRLPAREIAAWLEADAEPAAISPRAGAGE